MHPDENTPHCTHLVYNQSRRLYWLGLFVPEAVRTRLYKVYALECELAHVKHSVTEEMIGNIRFAWWREHVEALYDGQVRGGHPVLEALKEEVDAHALPKEQAMALIELHEDAYPDHLAQSDAQLEMLSKNIIHAANADALPAWQAAWDTIMRHEKKHGEKKRVLLLLKLWWLGTKPRTKTQAPAHEAAH